MHHVFKLKSNRLNNRDFNIVYFSHNLAALRPPHLTERTSNPDLVSQMLPGYSQMQQLLKRNPNVSSMFSNPEFMRQVRAELS